MTEQKDSLEAYFHLLEQLPGKTLDPEMEEKIKDLLSSVTLDDLKNNEKKLTKYRKHFRERRVPLPEKALRAYYDWMDTKNQERQTPGLGLSLEAAVADTAIQPLKREQSKIPPLPRMSIPPEPKPGDAQTPTMLFRAINAQLDRKVRSPESRKQIAVRLTRIPDQDFVSTASKCLEIIDENFNEEDIQKELKELIFSEQRRRRTLDPFLKRASEDGYISSNLENSIRGYLSKKDPERLAADAESFYATLKVYKEANPRFPDQDLIGIYSSIIYKAKRKTIPPPEQMSIRVEEDEEQEEDGVGVLSRFYNWVRAVFNLERTAYSEGRLEEIVEQVRKVSEEAEQTRDFLKGYIERGDKEREEILRSINDLKMELNESRRYLSLEGEKEEILNAVEVIVRKANHPLAVKVESLEKLLGQLTPLLKQIPIMREEQSEIYKEQGRRYESFRAEIKKLSEVKPIQASASVQLPQTARQELLPYISEKAALAPVKKPSQKYQRSFKEKMIVPALIGGLVVMSYGGYRQLMSSENPFTHCLYDSNKKEITYLDKERSKYGIEQVIYENNIVTSISAKTKSGVVRETEGEWFEKMKPYAIKVINPCLK